MEEDRLIGVFDIGKTNKKFTVYGESLREISCETTRFGEVMIDSFLCEDSNTLVKWSKSVLSKWLGKLSALTVTTHGATVALLGGDGGLVMPIISYNHEVGEEVKRSFYREFGSPEDLYVRTGTPPLGQLLNAGVQLYWVSKHFPEKYARVKRILFLPQYVIRSLTGFEAVEVTSLGCHTYLWDFAARDWSKVAEELNVPPLFPDIRCVWEPIGEYSGAVVAAGIHDSNASLLPFLVTGGDDFVLASTGTWCVLMYPGAPFKPSREDVYRDILYYADVYGRPVKAARFKCGFEFDYYLKYIGGENYLNLLALELDRDLAVDVLKSREMFFVPTLTPGTGQFPKSRGRVEGSASDPLRAYYYLNLSLAVQTWYALKLITGERKLKVFVQGGFSKNKIYLTYLATLAREWEVFEAEYHEATSLGAALTALSALEGVEPRKLRVEIPVARARKVDPLHVEERLVESYREHFISLCSRTV